MVEADTLARQECDAIRTVVEGDAHVFERL